MLIGESQRHSGILRIPMQGGRRFAKVMGAAPILKRHQGARVYCINERPQMISLYSQALLDTCSLSSRIVWLLLVLSSFVRTFPGASLL